MGAEDDYILGLNEVNCPTFKSAVDKKWPAFEQTTKETFKDFYSNLQAYFGF